MKVEIITIGDELLIGQTIDTNSAWMGHELNKIGFEVLQITSVSDNSDEIKRALKEAEVRVGFILVTGGLGPTKDDITKHTLCEYFNSILVFNEEVLKIVEGHFLSRGLVMPEVNKNQAMVPNNCEVLMNEKGTAPGMLFRKGEKIIVSMPGVPYEMKGIMTNYVLPLLSEKNVDNHIVHHTVLTFGIGESFLMEIIKNWEDSLAQENIKLAYLPGFGNVKLRLTKSGKNKEEIEKTVTKKVEELKILIPNYYFGENEDTMESVVGKLLSERGATLSTAESCTGGFVSHLITSVSGSSSYFLGGVVAYDNVVKKTVLKVSNESLINFGAVSSEVVEQMAKGVLTLLNTDYAIATSGIAGPDGGSEQKPVGTVWIAVASKEKVVSEKFVLGNKRKSVIFNASVAALNLLRKEFLLQ